jgi:hypothetical protein
MGNRTARNTGLPGTGVEAVGDEEKMNGFKDARKQAAYEQALTMHATLIREGSGRGIAYRRGWDGLPWPREWTSYPVYCAGRDNRKIRKLLGQTGDTNSER